MSADEQKRLDTLSINTIRMLAVDMVEKANSGHPGLPLGAAPMAYVLWTRFLKHNPANPKWSGRDRFILSAGHGSALLYALLHLCGYDLPMEELKNFRQWGSLTPGHPEYGLTAGVEATTGPLGQGFAMGAGMALAEAFLADQYNRPDHDVVDHYTYALVSDGDLMEGVAAEAASLAGTMSLGKLIYLYDDNGISIEGPTSIAFTEDVSRRFQAYGWQVIRVADGTDIVAIETAIQNAQNETEKPSLVMVRTHIGQGSPKQDSPSAHGEPLGAEAMAKTREHYGWPEETFHVPDEVRTHMAAVKEKGARAEAEWQSRMEKYGQAHPDLAADYTARMAGKLPDGWRGAAPAFAPEDGPLATRAASGKVLNGLAEKIPTMIGGSADLAPSNKTVISGAADFGSGQKGARNIRFGVREHAMAAMVNGMALHGGLVPYGGTFLVFADYLRPSLRLAALMQVNSTFVFTHDSIGVGEDGPTHQPVEQVAALRAIPEFTVLRPCDANETAAAWKIALESRGPAALILTRQKLPVLDPGTFPTKEGPQKGAYVLAGAGETPDVIIMASGSEVHLALAARELLARDGLKARVVSMPSWEVFEAQDPAYRDEVLPPAVKARVAVEAGCSMGWRKYAGDGGQLLTIDRFGASAPGGRVFQELGFTAENVAALARKAING